MSQKTCNIESQTLPNRTDMAPKRGQDGLQIEQKSRFDRRRVFFPNYETTDHKIETLQIKNEHSDIPSSLCFVR